MILDRLQEMAAALGGHIEEVAGPLPDGSGFATMSYPLPSDHWLYGDDDYEPPPMPMKIGLGKEREALAAQVCSAARYAIRASTNKGKITDFDPDAMVQNFVVGLLGYWTGDGLSQDAWANPPQFRNPQAAS